MSRWYRAYAGTIKDDKLAEAAVVAGCSRSVVIATWHAILESAAETAGGGRFDTTSRRVAAALGEPASVIEAVFSAMQEIGLVSGSEIPAWKRRQYESDNSTERSRRHREAARNGNATLQERCATPPDTDTETDTERKKQDTSLRSVERASAPTHAPKVKSEDLAKRRLIALGVPDDLLSDFLRIRKAHKAPLTDNAVLGLIREFETAGLTETEGIRLCVERNWRGFRAEYLKGNLQSKRASNAH